MCIRSQGRAEELQESGDRGNGAGGADGSAPSVNSESEQHQERSSVTIRPQLLSKPNLRRYGLLCQTYQNQF